jgi:putative ABC transport system permease protein
MQRQVIRIAIRSFSRTPGFTVTALLTLALGIGLSTAVFTVAEVLLLRRLPVVEQDRIAILWGRTRDGSFDNYPLGLSDAREFAGRAQSLTRVAWFAYYGAAPVAIVQGDEVSRMRQALVSGEFFDVLGAQPLLGRALRPGDDAAGVAPVIVLSHAAWRGRFSSDPQIIGQRVQMHDDRVTYTIVGVMPRGLDYPRGVDFWAPIMPSVAADKLQLYGFNLMGRLRTGIQVPDARAELTAFFARADAALWERQLLGVVHTLPRLVLGDTKPAVIAFAAAAGLLLLITCINVANLLLVRGLGRVREIAVRAALGASRTRINSQLLIENALLALVGGAGGVIVAAIGVWAFRAFAPARLPRLDEIHLNVFALAAALALSTIALLIFGLIPAWMTSRSEAQLALRAGMRQSASRRTRLGMEALVAGQIALALVVLGAAGLIAKTLIKLERAELSFESSRLLIGELTLHRDRFGDGTQQVAMLERLLPQLRALPGVQAVSPVVAVPFSGSSGWDGRLAGDDQTPEQAASNPMLNIEVVAPEYFTTLGIAVQRGRAFTAADRAGAPAVIVLSESTARYFWPGGNPVGKRLRMGGRLERVFTVIGVVPDTRYRDLRAARASVYFPLAQSFFPVAPQALVLRTTVPAGEIVPSIRRTIAATEPGVALAAAAPFATFLEQPLAQPRLNALLLMVFAAAAVGLAALGLFSVMATMVRQRTHELGVRLALGANSADLRRLLMRRGVGVSGLGMSAGLIGATAANRFLDAMLYEVSPSDPTTLVTVAALMLGIVTIASLIPAQAAARSEVLTTLRAEG